MVEVLCVVFHHCGDEGRGAKSIGQLVGNIEAGHTAIIGHLPGKIMILHTVIVKGCRDWSMSNNRLLQIPFPLPEFTVFGKPCCKALGGTEWFSALHRPVSLSEPAHTVQ